MSTKMSLNHNVSRETLELFEGLTQKLGSPKYRILEAAIDAFNALPRETQRVLKSYDQPDRQLYLELLHALQVPLKQAQPDRPVKGVKSASATIKSLDFFPASRNLLSVKNLNDLIFGGRENE